MGILRRLREWREDKNGTLIGPDIDADSVTTEQEHRTSDSPILLGSVGRRENFDGTDADERLDNALSAASNGDTIILENAEYSSPHTIANRLTLRGLGGTNSNGSRFTADITFSVQSVRLVGLAASFTSHTITVQGRSSAFINCGLYGSSIDAQDNQCRVVGCEGGDVTFASGTNGGIVDASIETTVTDNGSNTVGDLG